MKAETISLYEKEGQVGEAVGAIVTLIVGVGVAVLIIIFMGALGGQAWNLNEASVDALTTTIVNRSVTMINSSAVSLGNANIVNSSLGVTNTTGTVLGLNNFVFDLSRGTVTLTNNTINNTAGLFSFVYGTPEIENSIKNAVLGGFTALETSADYLPIIVLAVVIFLVLIIVTGLGGVVGGDGAGKGGSAVL